MPTAMKSMSLALFTFCLCLPAQEALAIPASGLVSYWQADGDATDSADGHDGTLKNGTGFASGMFGQAFSFDGVNDVVGIPHHPDLQPGTITVGAWIKTGSTAAQLIVDKSHGFIDQTGWALQVIGGSASWAYGNNSFFPEVGSTTVVSDNQFHHVAATLDGTGGTMRLYIDGVQEASLSFTGAPTGNARPVHIGAAYGGDLSFTNYVRPFDGLIDEVALYNRVLNARLRAPVAKGVMKDRCGQYTKRPLAPTVRGTGPTAERIT